MPESPQSAPGQEFVEQYLLFDNTEYIEGIGHVGQIALIELIGDDGVQELRKASLLDVSPPQVADVDHWSRLFEI